MTARLPTISENGLVSTRLGGEKLALSAPGPVLSRDADVTVARIVVTFDLAGASPSEAGARFVSALKQAIVDAHLGERLDSADLDAIFAVLPQLREA